MCIIGLFNLTGIVNALAYLTKPHYQPTVSGGETRTVSLEVRMEGGWMDSSVGGWVDEKVYRCIDVFG